jgi:hypothetical protein
MIKRLTSLLLAVFFLCGTLTAEAATYRCQAVFRPSLSDVLYDLNKNSDDFLLGENLAEFTKDMSLSRKRKIRKILNNTSIGDLVSERAVTNFAVELSALLFDQRGQVDNFIFKTTESRAKESAIGLIQEKILRKGLLNAWDGYSPVKARKLEKLIFGLRWSLDKVSIVTDSKARFVLNLPLLSKAKNNEISDELMQKILRDGYDAHEAEAMLEMKSQSRVEGYNAFRRIFNVALLGSVVVVGTYIGVMAKMEESERAVNQQISNLQEIRAGIEGIGALRDEIYDAAVQGALLDFELKNDDLPTPVEQDFIKQKVIDGIHNKLNERGNL